VILDPRQAGRYLKQWKRRWIILTKDAVLLTFPDQDDLRQPTEIIDVRVRASISPLAVPLPHEAARSCRRLLPAPLVVCISWRGCMYVCDHARLRPSTRSSHPVITPTSRFLLMFIPPICVFRFVRPLIPRKKVPSHSNVCVCLCVCVCREAKTEGCVQCSGSSSSVLPDARLFCGMIASTTGINPSSSDCFVCRLSWVRPQSGFGQLDERL
jgi:hypothetical protein